jgi:hypothetical protein
MGPYSTPPAADDERVLGAIQRHRPEEIAGLAWTKPDFSAQGHKIVRTFAVERKKRPGLECVPCAICCSRHPKFLDGAVLWSPDGWLRIIGHVCAAKPEHFGTRDYRILRRQREQEVLDAIAFDWLHANLPALRSLAPVVAGLRGRALFAEEQQSVFFRDVPELAVLLQNAARGHGGALTVSQELAGARLVASEVARGRAARPAEHEVVNLGAMRGLAFLARPKFKRSRQLEGVAAAFGKVPAGEGEQPILDLIAMGGEQAVTVAAAVVFRAMQRALKLAQECADAERFLAADNLAVLQSWGQDARNPTRLTLRRYGSRVAFVLADRSQALLQAAWPTMPDLSLLRAVVGAGMQLDKLLPKSAG